MDGLCSLLQLWQGQSQERASASRRTCARPLPAVIETILGVGLRRHQDYFKGWVVCFVTAMASCNKVTSIGELCALLQL